MTQNEKVLDYIRTQGSITAMEAFKNLGITRLSARIYDLRRSGVKIVQERKFCKTKSGANHYDIFRLGDEK